jgi:hypothetical protein
MSWPAGVFSDQVVVELQPMLASSILSLPPNSIVIDVTAHVVSTGASVTDLGNVVELLFRNAPAGMRPMVSSDGTAWREIPELSSPQLPAGQPDGFFRADNAIHILTRHLTLYALTPQVAQTKLVMRIMSAPRVWVAHDFVGVRLELTAPARVKSWFSDASATPIPNTSQKTGTLRAGATILRLRLPNLPPGTYRLQLRAEGVGQATARTARIRILKTQPWTIGSKPLGVVVVTGPSQRRLHQLQAMLGPQFNVRTTISSLLYNAVDGQRGRTAGVVLDLDTVPLALVSGLHAVYPEVQIIGLASDAGTAKLYQRAGATVVLAKPVNVWAVRQALRQLLLRNP